jgi:predicted aldo/keto reductase-like oxidoreductase
VHGPSETAPPLPKNIAIPSTSRSTMRKSSDAQAVLHKKGVNNNYSQVYGKASDCVESMQCVKQCPSKSKS